MTDEAVRILHLSDFHFSEKKQWDADAVLSGLVREVANLAQNDLSPDIIAMTGDLAHAGKPSEYTQASKWIDERLLPAAGGLSKQRVLIVPGNHDVDRGVVSTGRVAKAVQNELLNEKSQDAIAAILGNANERDVLLKRHAAYMDFADAYGPTVGHQSVPWWSVPVEVRELRIFFAGVCSSWMSWCDKDRGDLLVGRWQARELLKDADDSADFDLRVVLMHHPWDYLAEFDKDEVQRILRDHADVILSGHRHREESTQVANPDQACIELSAGCVYEDSSYPNAFHLIEAMPGEGRIRVHYHTWHRGKWIIDRNAYAQAPNGYADFVSRAQAAGTEKRKTRTKAREPDPGEYLRRLRTQTEYIDIRGLSVGSGKAHRFPIHELYIPLTTSAPMESRESKRGAKRNEGEPSLEREARIELDDILQERRVVIVGDPGSGKTTFLKRIANLLCESRLGEKPDSVSERLGLAEAPLPVLIPLTELAEHIATCRKRHEGPTLADAPEWLAHFLSARNGDADVGLGAQFFAGRMKDGTALLLLDALDEAPTELQRKTLSMLVEKASREAYAKCGFVVTTRPAAYQGGTVIADFKEVRINDLEDEAIEFFLQRWCAALFPQDSSEARQHLNELIGAVRSRSDIRKLARNPVMLTALAVVHWNEKRLPEQRAELYDSVLTWLARSRERRPDRPPAEVCLILHQELALAMQDNAEGRQTQVSRYWAAEQLAERWPGEPTKDRVSHAEAFLIQEEADSGIVVSRGDDVRFWHLTFQEYLAAKALASCSEVEQRKRLLARPEKLHASEWRETFLLMAGVLYHQGVRRVDAMMGAILDKLSKRASLAEKARCCGLLGSAMRDLSPVGYQPRDRRYKQLTSAVMAIFKAERSRSVPIERAIEAAEAIGLAGDPRFASFDSDDLWVTIPGGTFWMGAQKRNPRGRNYDASAWGKGKETDEEPEHEVWLSSYRIGRYPVTVAEYDRFVDRGGYEREEFWSAGGFGKWDRPDDWDEQLGHPTRPVVSVNWFEAAAYASWAAELVYAGCRLPTEAEWERAARGTDGRRYPWGSDKEASSRLANFNESRVGHATPVGVYPLGASAEGVLDMAGNVWEWCGDWYGSYSADAQVDPRGPAAGESRVLRGGAWRGGAGLLRSALRGRGGPDARVDLIGFRLAAGT